MKLKINCNQSSFSTKSTTPMNAVIRDNLCNLVPFMQFKNKKNIHGGVSVKLHASACNVTNGNTPP